MHLCSPMRWYRKIQKDYSSLPPRVRVDEKYPKVIFRYDDRISCILLISRAIPSLFCVESPSLFCFSGHSLALSLSMNTENHIEAAL